MELQILPYTNLDPSQAASRVSWEFMNLCQGKSEYLPQIATAALNLCQSVEAAGAFIAGKSDEDVPAINALPAARRRMLLSKGLKQKANLSKYKTIAGFACKYNDVLEEMKLGKRELSQDELEQLRTHFSHLSSILVEADL
jgi:hypothetical protein